MEEVVPGPHLNYEILIWSHLDENKGDFGRPEQESRIGLLTFAKAEFAVFLLLLLSSHSLRMNHR